MANRIEIDIVANDKTGNALASFGDKLTGLGLGLSKLTDPMMDMWKKLFKTEEIKAAIEPVKEAFGGVLSELATALVPVIEQITPFLLDMARALENIVMWFSNLSSPVQALIVGLVALLTVIGPILIIIGSLMTAFSLLAPALSAAAAAVGLTVGPFLLIVAAIAAVVAAIVIFWPEIKQFFINVAEWAKTKFEEAKNTITTKWAEIKEAISTKLQEIWTAITTKFTEIKDWIKGMVGEWYNVGRDLILGLVDGVKDYVSHLWTAVKDGVGEAIDWARSILGEHSPSKVFMDIGKNMMLGWAEGINKSAFQPQMAISSAAGGMVASAIPSGGRGAGVGNTIVVNYSPVVSLADRYEAETKLVPYIESALRKIR